MRNLQIVLCATVIAASFISQAEEANRLNEVLADGETWLLVSDKLGFTDAACSDADGNVYFSDMNAGVIFKIDAVKGEVAPFVDAAKISGAKWGPDGRLYCCQNGAKKIIAIDKEKKVSVLAENVGCNDLVVSKKGIVYFTETGKGQVTMIDEKGVVKEGAKDLGKANGISLSADQKTLAVSNYGGTEVFTLKIADDGTLSDKQATMTMKCPADKGKVSGGDGMTTAASGHYFVTSNLGIQVFDKDGALLGVIEKPQAKAMVNVAFGGTDMKTLYCCCSDKVYKRKMKVAGIVFYK